MPVSKPRSRYTPPPAKKAPPSPMWVPALMFALLGVGAIVIIFNYLGILPGDQQNSYLFIGLIEITAGFVVATFWH